MKKHAHSKESFTFLDQWYQRVKDEKAAYKDMCNSVSDQLNTYSDMAAHGGQILEDLKTWEIMLQNKSLPNTMEIIRTSLQFQHNLNVAFGRLSTSLMATVVSKADHYSKDGKEFKESKIKDDRDIARLMQKSEERYINVLENYWKCYVEFFRQGYQLGVSIKNFFVKLHPEDPVLIEVPKAFGKDLTQIWEDETDLRIATYILKYFEEYGSLEESVFTDNIHPDAVKSIIQALEKGTIPLTGSTEAMAHVLLHWLNSLTDPIFSFDLQKDFFEVANMVNMQIKKEKMSALLAKLPRPNRIVLLAVLRGCVKIAREKSVGSLRYTQILLDKIADLAAALGPSLTRCSAEQAPLALSLLRYLILNSELFFPLGCEDERFFVTETLKLGRLVQLAPELPPPAPLSTPPLSPIPTSLPTLSPLSSSLSSPLSASASVPLSAPLSYSSAPLSSPLSSSSISTDFISPIKAMKIGERNSHKNFLSPAPPSSPHIHPSPSSSSSSSSTSSSPYLHPSASAPIPAPTHPSLAPLPLTSSPSTPPQSRTVGFHEPPPVPKRVYPPSYFVNGSRSTPPPIIQVSEISEEEPEISVTNNYITNNPITNNITNITPPLSSYPSISSSNSFSTSSSSISSSSISSSASMSTPSLPSYNPSPSTPPPPPSRGMIGVRTVLRSSNSENAFPPSLLPSSLPPSSALSFPSSSPSSTPPHTPRKNAKKDMSDELSSLISNYADESDLARMALGVLGSAQGVTHGAAQGVTQGAAHESVQKMTRDVVAKIESMRAKADQTEIFDEVVSFALKLRAIIPEVELIKSNLQMGMEFDKTELAKARGDKLARLRTTVHIFAREVVYVMETVCSIFNTSEIPTETRGTVSAGLVRVLAQLGNV